MDWIPISMGTGPVWGVTMYTCNQQLPSPRRASQAKYWVDDPNSTQIPLHAIKARLRHQSAQCANDAAAA
jgi:hypothetical protein